MEKTKIQTIGISRTDKKTVRDYNEIMQKHWDTRGRTGHIQKNGYRVFCKGARIVAKKKYEHRAVWERNNGPIPKGYIVHHIDGNKLNNSIGNLQLMSRAEHSMIHAVENKLGKDRTGVPPINKIPIGVVQKMKDLRATGMLIKDIASIVGHHKETVRKYVKGVL